MIPARPAAILFDMDGLLLDTERLTRDAMIAEMAGRRFSMTHDDYAALFGLTEEESAAVMAARFGATLDYDALRRDVERRIQARVGVHRPLKAAAAALVAQVRNARIPAAVVTSTEQAIARAHLAAVGLLDSFVTIIGGDDVVSGKPHPEPYGAAVARLGIAPESALAHEDSHNGVLSAHGAGVPVIMVPDLLPATPAIRARTLAVATDLAVVAQWLRAAASPQSGPLSQ